MEDLKETQKIEMILIVNRGEISRSIIKITKRVGIHTGGVVTGRRLLDREETLSQNPRLFEKMMKLLQSSLLGNNNADIPSEIISQILSRVPALTLLRFRCVSKPWRSMIDSPDFIKMHLNQTLQTNSDRKLILRCGSLFSADLDAFERTNSAVYAELDYPLNRSGVGTDVLGSCHGLLCLDCGVEDKDIVLWNPTTRNHFKLPFSEYELRDDVIFLTWSLVYGFGYDKVSDDYKVLRIIQSYDFEGEVKVFRLKLNSWKKLPPFPYYMQYKRAHGVLAGGSLHWVVCSDPDAQTGNLISAFDLSTEEFRLLPRPMNLSKGDFVMNVEVLGGSLCVTCNYEGRHIDFWVLKNYAVKESWTKLFRVAQSNVKSAFDYVIPVAYSNNGGKVFMVQDDKELLWYDLEKRKIVYSTFCISKAPSFMEHRVYFGSLVQLSGSAGRVPDRRRAVDSKGTKTKSKKDEFLSVGFKLVL